MATAIMAFRAVPLLVFAAAMALAGRGSGRGESQICARGSRAPLVANVMAFAVWAVSLISFSSDSASSSALFLAASGSMVALAGVATVAWSRVELGPGWSLAPEVGRGIGPVTTGPYRFVRHPIYFGLALLALGESLAFVSWPAVMMVVCGLLPTFMWRARTEEELLRRTFGEGYIGYRDRTRMIIPYLL